MADILTHAFVSAKANSPDGTIVSSTAWNDGHVFGGGVTGQTLVFDNTKVDNIKWVDGARTFAAQYVVPSSLPSPITSVAQMVFTTVAGGSYIHVVVADAITTVGSVDVSLDLLTNGAVRWTYIMPSGPTVSRAQTVLTMGNLVIGSNTLSVTIRASANITAGNLACWAFTVGQ